MKIKSKITSCLFYFFTTLAFSQVSGVGLQLDGVGINEKDPQQALHLGSQTGTIRIDGLNSTNNPRNGGGVNNTFPLFVDENGDLLLQNKVNVNHGGNSNIWSSSNLINSSITVPNSGTNGVTRLLYTETVVVTKPTVVEIKYALSFEVKRNASNNLQNNRARRISNYFTIGNATRKYGQSSKCYFNNDANANCATGNLYNGATTYITLPSAGTYNLNLWGEVNTGTTNNETLVNFGTGYNTFYLRLY